MRPPCPRRQRPLGLCPVQWLYSLWRPAVGRSAAVGLQFATVPWWKGCPDDSRRQVDAGYLTPPFLRGQLGSQNDCKLPIPELFRWCCNSPLLVLFATNTPRSCNINPGPWAKAWAPGPGAARSWPRRSSHRVLRPPLQVKSLCAEGPNTGSLTQCHR